MAKYDVRLFETATYVVFDVEADSEAEAVEIAKEVYEDNSALCIESSIDEFVPYVKLA